METALRRARLIVTHVLGGDKNAPSLQPNATSSSKSNPGASGRGKKASSIDVQQLSAFLSHDNEFRQKVCSVISDPFFRHQFRVEVPEAEHRELSAARVVKLNESRLVSVRDIRNNPMKYFAFVESLFTNDLSFGAKTTIHYNMFGACVLNLGTQFHHDKFLDDIDSMKMKGCFAMSELGHGSNVRQIETIATFDSATDEFVIETPTDNAQKYWIGGAAKYANWSSVFAQLIIAGKNYGVHCFLVQLRDDQGQNLPGIRTADCGHKMGLNGIDNGRIWFDRVRIPRSHLLNRFGSVDRDGTYSSPIKSSGHRFLANIGELLVARLVASLSCGSASRIGLAIAIKYAHDRTQFGPPNSPEAPIMDFLSHQVRLMPLLAATYGITFLLHHCKLKYSERVGSEDMKDLHVIVSGVKAYSSWLSIDTLQACRECCGGQGYLTRNLISALRVDTDIFSTLDGDNSVLMQMVAKALLDQFTGQFKKWRKDYFELISHVSQEARLAARVSNPLSTHVFAQAHLRAADFQLEAFLYREHAQVRELALRLQKASLGLGAKRVGALEAWNSVLPEAIELGRAHMDRLVLEQLVEAEKNADASFKEPLSLMRSLFALSKMSEDAWFLSSGNLAPIKARAVKRQVVQLCTELRPFSLDLVNAFGIPDFYLEGTIASDWRNLNKYQNTAHSNMF